MKNNNLKFLSTFEDLILRLKRFYEARITKVLRIFKNLKVHLLA